MLVTPASGRPHPWRIRPHLPFLVLGLLSALLVLAALMAVAVGAAGIPPARLLALIGLGHSDMATLARDGLVLGSIRLPRIALALIVGALLASAGAVMQGLFRNPLADPALVGVSGGAALAAAATIVVGDRLAALLGLHLPMLTLPVAAFAGALVTTLALYRLATSDGRTSIATFLLGGLALASLASAGLGLLVYLADDRQLRDVTFWMLGSLAGATWDKVGVTAPFLLLAALVLPLVARGLDLLVLGEAEAFHAGIAVERLKRWCIVLVAASVGAAVSVTGVIGFVGIVVPHLLRLIVGPGHRLLIPASMLLGAALLLIADTGARLIVAPAELPIGILTALIGAPFFLWLLLRQRGAVLS